MSGTVAGLLLQLREQLIEDRDYEYQQSNEQVYINTVEAIMQVIGVPIPEPEEVSDEEG